MRLRAVSTQDLYREEQLFVWTLTFLTFACTRTYIEILNEGGNTQKSIIEYFLFVCCHNC